MWNFLKIKWTDKKFHFLCFFPNKTLLWNQEIICFSQRPLTFQQFIISFHQRKWRNFGEAYFFKITPASKVSGGGVKQRLFEHSKCPAKRYKKTVSLGGMKIKNTYVILRAVKNLHFSFLVVFTRENPLSPANLTHVVKG